MLASSGGTRTGSRTCARPDMVGNLLRCPPAQTSSGVSLRRCAFLLCAWSRDCGQAPVAQLDRAPDYESGGRGFESCPVRQRFQVVSFLPCLSI